MSARNVINLLSKGATWFNIREFTVEKGFMNAANEDGTGVGGVWGGNRWEDASVVTEQQMDHFEGGI